MPLLTYVHLSFHHDAISLDEFACHLMMRGGEFCASTSRKTVCYNLSRQISEAVRRRSCNLSIFSVLHALNLIYMLSVVLISFLIFLSKNAHADAVANSPSLPVTLLSHESFFWSAGCRRKLLLDGRQVLIRIQATSRQCRKVARSSNTSAASVTDCLAAWQCHEGRFAEGFTSSKESVTLDPGKTAHNQPHVSWNG